MEYFCSFSSESFSFDFGIENDKKKFIEKLLIAYRKKFTFFINMLVSLCDIHDVEKGKENQLAYTKLNIYSERIDIFINFKKIACESFSHEQVLFLIFHELLHNYLYHFSRFSNEIKEGNGEIVNIATDYFVNNICSNLLGDNVFDKFKKNYNLVSYEFLEKIYKENNSTLENRLYIEKNWTEKTLYDSLSKILPKVYKIDGNKIDDHNESSKNSNSESSKNTLNKNLSKETITDIFFNKIKAVEKEILEYGFSPSEEEIINRKIFLVKPDYFLNDLKLKRIITKSLNGILTKTYSKTNRKRKIEDIILKGKKKTNCIKLIICLDVSGSISDKDLNIFFNMLEGLQKNKSAKFDIIFWSSCVLKYKEHAFKDIDNVKLFCNKTKIESSGGTDISTLHNFLNENYKNQIEVINITDGCFYLDKNLNKNISKYHFVLTKNISDSFSNFYNDCIFDLVSINQQKTI